ncbi:MAG: Fur family transcriptional regulator [Gammaproteobacteria bacterium]
MIREDVVQLLGRNGITITPQRVDVAEVLFARPQHVSAEQIIDQLKTQGKSVSKATVYNTLNRFVTKGIAKIVNVNPERAFYDSVTSHHHHFYNSDTGEITDISPEHVVLEQLPEVPEGTEMSGVEVVINLRNR